MKENKRLLIIMPFIVAIIFAAGMFIGKYMAGVGSTDEPYVLYPSPDKLSTIVSYIVEEYVDPVSREELIEKTIPIMLEQLDPHSIYIPAKDLQAVNEPLEGEFDGIGVQFNIQHDTVVVINTISGGPSEKLGILPGDRIVTIDDSLFVGPEISSEGVMKLLRGKSGTVVVVGIKRKGIHDLIFFEITRGKIPLYSVDVAYMLNDEIGYIKISKFSRTTYSEFEQAAKTLKKQGMTKVVLDLRGNSGGYMDAAIKIADEFLNKGKLIVYTKGKAHPKVSSFATENGMCQDDEVVVLIDEWSASASEIVAGAIQDNDRGMIVGRRSFGKGLVQEPMVFTDGSAMRLTIARYYTPAGRCIQKPYNGNIDDYYGDIGERYLNGELEHIDTTLFADSLKYYTPQGRVVYGGGGIMPDVFVSVDTTGASKLLSNVISKGLIYKYAFEYVDTNRSVLTKYEDVYQLLDYLESQNIYRKFIAFVKTKGVKVEEEDVKTSGYIIETQLLAFICRNIFDNEGYFPIIRRIDEPLIKSVNILGAN
ncbi:MAG: peptidase S41 [Marinilabiliales bacterium]|nr:MAG: peptidase S41 [Marinilabiliales bacterium]